MEWIEITAKTVASAIEKALDTLGVHETELEYETIEAESSKLFGLRKSDARIKARVKPISREKPNDKRRRKQREERRSRGGRDSGRASEDGGNASSESPKTNSSSTSNSPKANRGPKPTGDRTNSGEAKAPKAKSTPKAKGSDRSVSEVNDDAEVAAAPKPNRPPKEREAQPMNGTIEEQLVHAHDFGTGLLDAFGIDANAEAVVVDDDVIELAITGQNLGLLVGPKAATLAALEELLRGSVGHRGPARLHLDVAGYRQKRRAALAEFARGVASEVLSTGVAKGLEPMSAADRKVVHDAINELDGVQTISDGEDQRRRVIIQPAS